jgi:hypothetical protein
MRNRKFIKAYRLQQPMPFHKVGDMLYKTHHDDVVYTWQEFTSDPYTYYLDAKIVESATDFFEEMTEHEWIQGEDIFFISTVGTILDEEYHPKRHADLVAYGNAFYTKEEAELQLANIKALLKGNK